MQKLSAKGVDLRAERFHIDLRAHVILPYHKKLDMQRELSRSKSGTAIGTTGRGIGPCYASKAYREGPRMADLLSEEAFDRVLKQNPHIEEDLDSETKKTLLSIGTNLQGHLKDVSTIVNNRLETGARVLLEGAQGAMLDVSFGTYPYVTSSNLIAGSCAGGLGIPPWRIRSITGVVKAYATRVGNGPFPGEISGTLETRLREIGNEFGSTTGRPRRVGWLDLVALRYIGRVNGLTGLAVMKSDVLCGFDSVGVVVAYRDKRNGEVMQGWPMTVTAWENIDPVIEFCEGWENVVEQSGAFDPNFKKFLNIVEDQCRIPVIYVSTGPERAEGVWLKNPSDMIV
jgi:adenylosuccinate synthase